MRLGPALEHPVHFEELPGQPVPDLPNHLDRARRAARHHHLYAREVVAIERRHIQNRDEMRRRTAEVGDPLALDESERLLGPEDVLKYESAAGVEGLEDVEQPPVEAGRKKDEEHAPCRDPLASVEKAQGAIRGVVNVQDRLRIAGGAGGEGSARQLVGMGTARATAPYDDSTWARIRSRFSPQP